MKKTPLFLQHVSRGAVTEVHGDWLLAERFAAVEAEVASVRAGAGLFDLCDTEVWELHSPDIRRWANGMFTNNLKKPKVGEGNRNALCDDRGRVHGLIDLYLLAEDRLLVVGDGVSRAAFEQRYEMYLTLDDVEVVDVAGAPSLLSLQGPGAEAVLAAAGLPIPSKDHAHGFVGGDPLAAGLRVMRRDRLGLGGFDLLVPASALGESWEALLRLGATPAGAASFEVLRVVAGRARWPQDAVERSMVHELRLAAEVCAFDKGCYVGQEVLNRVDIKGSINWKLMGLELAEDALPPAGAVVVVADADGGSEEVGKITSACRFAGRVLALGALKKIAWTPGAPVTVVAGDRRVAAVVCELPFRGGVAEHPQDASVLA